MSEAAIAEHACHTDHYNGGSLARVRHWIGLTAAPSFALMALLTAGLGGGPADILCSPAHGVSALAGMVPMYVLMSAFHSAPWWELLSKQPRHPPKMFCGEDDPRHRRLSI